jgi:hypothetical protein
MKKGILNNLNYMAVGLGMLLPLSSIHADPFPVSELERWRAEVRRLVDDWHERVLQEMEALLRAQEATQLPVVAELHARWRTGVQQALQVCIINLDTFLQAQGAIQSPVAELHTRWKAQVWWVLQAYITDLDTVLQAQGATQPPGALLAIWEIEAQRLANDWREVALLEMKRDLRPQGESWLLSSPPRMSTRIWNNVR